MRDPKRIRVLLDLIENGWLKRPIELCPYCKSDLIGEPIPESIRHNYNPPYYWNRKIGLYDSYKDRLVQWQCPDCGGIWDRDGYEN